MGIYTKRGDKGETSLFDEDSSQRKRISKDSRRIWAIGAVDEANSLLGVCAAFLKDKKLKKEVFDIQKDLFKINSILAGANLRFSKTKTKKLERRIDNLQKELPVLKNFILPGGSKEGSFLHLARPIVRRAEREISGLSKVEEVKPQIQSFVNRLSDYIFMLARKVNKDKNAPETIWVGKKK